MNLYELVLVVHVLGWVFWLGTDVGVFFAARWSEREALSPEARLTVLQLGLFLDRWPRFAVPVVWVTGVYLMSVQGYAIIPVAMALPVALFWLAVTWAVIFQPPGSPWQARALGAQAAIYAAVVIGMGGGAAWLLATGELPLWLAIKWFAYVGVAVTAVLLERAFAPVGALFGELATAGASDDLNARIHRAMAPAYPIVLAIYACTIVAGVSGLLKPML
jgi:uncharacterized membrane protein